MSSGVPHCASLYTYGTRRVVPPPSSLTLNDRFSLPLLSLSFFGVDTSWERKDRSKIEKEINNIFGIIGRLFRGKRVRSNSTVRQGTSVLETEVFSGGFPRSVIEFKTKHLFIRKM